jgi:transcriptional regulator with XRE-family HTH domain
MAHNTALKLAIFSRGRTQIDVAQRAAIHPSRLSKIIRGHQAPRRLEREALARVLRMPVDELFPAPAPPRRRSKAAA